MDEIQAVFSGTVSLNYDITYSFSPFFGIFGLSLFQWKTGNGRQN